MDFVAPGTVTGPMPLQEASMVPTWTLKAFLLLELPCVPQIRLIQRKEIFCEVDMYYGSKYNRAPNFDTSFQNLNRFLLAGISRIVNVEDNL